MRRSLAESIMGGQAEAVAAAKLLAAQQESLGTSLPRHPALSPRLLALAASASASSLGAMKPRVRWSDPVAAVVGVADGDYDRRSIKVDLTNTPYALFHKDYYLMQRPAEYSPKHTKEARSPSWSSDDEDAHTEGEGGSSSDEGEATEAMRKRQQSMERRRASRPNFSGVWKRARIEGFIELLVFSGVPHKAALAAAQKRPLHIIDHDDDYFRLIVKNGLTKADSHYIIGDEPRIERSGGRDYEVVLEWGHGTANGRAESLVLTSVTAPAGTTPRKTPAVEMIAVRTLEENGDVLVLQQIVRKPATGEEARARHVFKRVTDRNSLCVKQRLPRPGSGTNLAQQQQEAEAAAKLAQQQQEAEAAADSGAAAHAPVQLPQHTVTTVAAPAEAAAAVAAGGGSAAAAAGAAALAPAATAAADGRGDRAAHTNLSICVEG